MSDEFPCSKKVSKCFVGYKDNKNYTDDCITSKTDWVCEKNEHGNTVSFLFKDEKLLVKYSEMWSKIKNIIKRKKIL